ncbi:MULTISPECIES: hypothetical protein [Megasphaera]|nr:MULTISPECIES: hypothetical protein [Megasphaera]MCQ5314302.1 hypothetical protein [Megasphaera massiliensis]MCQ5322962.1 hypothetical protein [Megasphaera massiliensis]
MTAHAATLTRNNDAARQLVRSCSSQVIRQYTAFAGLSPSPVR